MEHQQSVNEERRNRFAVSGADTPRSASQPPTTNGGESFYAPAMQIYGSPNLDGSNRNGNSHAGNMGSPWAMSSGRMPAMTRSSSIGIPSSVTRSNSLSSSVERAASYAGSFSSAMRDAHAFPSTFEDDESEALSDATGDYSPYQETNNTRGRHYLGTIDPRSRSQSLATTTATRPLPIGSPPTSGGWAIPGSIPGRFTDVKNFGATGMGSRYNSFGGEFSRSPVPSPTGLRVQQQHRAEISNISPLARDIGHIMYDEDWSRNGGDSGATSRRHSVSGGLQARRGIVGFNAPDSQSDPYPPEDYGKGLAVDDDDLAATFNSMSLGNSENGRSHAQPISQPSSLPIYAPLSQASKEQQANLSESLRLATAGLAARMRRSPSESAHSAGGEAGSANQSPALDQYVTRQQAQGQRYMHYDIPEDETEDQHQLQSQPRLSPTLVRGPSGPNASYMHLQTQQPTSPTRHLMHQMQLLHQQQLANASPIQRRASQSEMLLGTQQLPQGPLHNLPQAPQPAPVVAELGKGIPLHAVPPSWTLYIVEFKAGRTDLFYVADSDTRIPPLHVGDLVIVEADRGKDLGKVVNDSITAQEVEAFQRQQAAAVQAQAYNEVQYGHGGGPVSPDGVPLSPTTPSTAKREINPKKIYGKANPHDAQYVLPCYFFSCCRLMSRILEDC